MIIDNFLLLRNSLQRLILRIHVLLAYHNDKVLVSLGLPGEVLVVRPLRHALEDLLREVVADVAAALGLVLAVLINATVFVEAGVGNSLVGNDTGSQDEQRQGEEVHCEFPGEFVRIGFVKGLCGLMGYGSVRGRRGCYCTLWNRHGSTENSVGVIVLWVPLETHVLSLRDHSGSTRA